MSKTKRTILRWWYKTKLNQLREEKLMFGVPHFNEYVKQEAFYLNKLSKLKNDE